MGLDAEQTHGFLYVMHSICNYHCHILDCEASSLEREAGERDIGRQIENLVIA